MLAIMRSLAKLAALALVCTVPLGAQVRPVFDTIPASAAPALASIVAAYQKEVATNQRDAELWHDLGINAWRLSNALAGSGTAGTEPARIGRLADSALAMAASLEPASVQYQLDMAWKLQASRLAITRVGSRRYLERALNAARTRKDPVMLAVAALEYGRSFWWQFDAIENRYQFTGLVAPRSVTDAMNPTARGGAVQDELNAIATAADANLAASPVRYARDLDFGPMDLARLLTNVTLPDSRLKGTFNSALNLLRTTSKALPGDLSGQPELERSSALFAEAYQAMPAYPGAFRAVAMTWVARGAWGNLERLAAAHVRALPRDSMARIARVDRAAESGHVHVFEDDAVGAGIRGLGDGPAAGSARGHVRRDADDR